ncbi:MAG: DNA-binding response regulator, luxR family protein, partial [Neobacillus sp.]|nr:DNA-binding response regulator, luxR family protein [Neobacillus sp.]
SDPTSLFTVIQQTGPTIVVMDVRIKSYNGIKLTKKILEEYPHIKVVILSGYDYDEYIQAAFQAGASAFVTKERSNVELVSAIKQSYEGYKVFPRNMAEIYQSCTGLTQKEREVLKLIAEDKTNYEISEELMISKRTVERHVSSILQKLDADSRVGAVVNGIKKGFLSI